MDNLWRDSEARQYTTDLALRVYTSQLLGKDPSLVLHGGGNTSVKIREKNILGQEETILYVKGSGWDLETIQEAGFSPVRLNHLLELAKLPTLSDTEMVNELRTHMTRASAPTPSVEAILHATLPYKYVDHTHADAVVTITNTRNGLERIKTVYGNSVVIIPYIMPGFDLARLCAEIFASDAHDGTIGMVLLNHGIFSFGETARESYDRMIHLVGLAETYLQDHDAWNMKDTRYERQDTDNPCRELLAEFRNRASSISGFPMILSTHQDEACMSFARHPQLDRISQQGPATPDHVIRTKRLPMLGRNFDDYASAYRRYFDEFSVQAKQPVNILDQAPRVMIDPEMGIMTLGKTAKDCGIIADIYQHTIEIILRAESLGGYQALPAKDIFDVEYWELEQAKLKKSGSAPQFTGEVVLITGAASGIGKACVESFLKRGAAVIGLDINPDIETLMSEPGYLGLACDLTETSQILECIEKGIRKFGGLDMLVLNAGMFPGGCRIESITDRDWHQVMQVNLHANLSLLRESYPLLKLAPRNGRVAIIGSKNVPAPGPGAAAYSASKAALNQLARIAALEWGNDGIRINTLHPDAVFDTGIWKPEILEARAQHYGMTVEEYKTKNILGAEVTSRDVAELAAELCGPLFAKTTGAQVPIDGGNDRVI